MLSAFHFPLGCLPSIPFRNSLPPLSAPLWRWHKLHSSARDRTRPFKFRLFPADGAEIELGIGAAAEWSADDGGTSGRRIHM